MQIPKNMNRLTGILILTSAERDIICTARIIPQSCCIEPPRISIKKKFPELKASKAPLAFSAFSVIEFAVIISVMIGGTAPPSSGIPSLKESLLIEVMSDLVLKIETSLMFMFISA